MDTLDVSPNDTFFYLDPPYYSIGKELYRSYYKNGDHVKLHDYVISTNYMWLISYDNNKYIRDLYKDQNIQEISLNHQAHIQHEGKEILISPVNTLYGLMEQ
jgi:DNA adenine methylase